MSKIFIEVVTAIAKTSSNPEAHYQQTGQIPCGMVLVETVIQSDNSSLKPHVSTRMTFKLEHYSGYSSVYIKARRMQNYILFRDTFICYKT